MIPAVIPASVKMEATISLSETFIWSRRARYQYQTPPRGRGG